MTKDFINLLILIPHNQRLFKDQFNFNIVIELTP